MVDWTQFSDCYYLAILIRALTEAIAAKAPPSTHAFDGFEDDGGDDEGFHNACLEEIDRYRRMDEWIPSHQNVLSTTALDCRRILVQAGVIPLRLADFLQYTPDGTSEYLRLCAFANLTELGLMGRDKILRWFLFVTYTDPSPYIRDQMLRIFNRVLGSSAIGEHLEAAKAQEAITDGLVIEQETTTEARKAEIARKQTIEGASNALRLELSRKEVLKTELWHAVTSPTISLPQMGDLLDICDLLYTPETSMVVGLKYPRYWKCTKVGKGKLQFSRTSRIRTMPLPQRRIQAPSPGIKRENSNSSKMAPPSTQRPQLILKLGGKKRTMSSNSGPPTPAPLESVTQSPVSANTQGEEMRPKIKPIKLKLKPPTAGSPPPSS